MAFFSQVSGIIFLHEIMRGTYLAKVQALDCFIRSVKNGMSLRQFVDRVFGSSVFSGTTIKKKEFIIQLSEDKISLDNWVFIRTILRNLSYLTDRRHSEEYALDIALGWISEEIFKEVIESQSGISNSVTLVGIDSQREFQSLNIRANADFEISKNGRNVLVDLFVDYLGTWQTNGGMDLKQGKISHFNKGKLDFVLGLDVQNKNVYLVKKTDIQGLSPTFNAAMGGKPTVRVPLNTPVPIGVLYSSF